MKKVIKLTKNMKINNNNVSEVTLDFDSIKGRDLADAERTARADGEVNPMITFSMKYQAAIAAKLLGMKYDDLLDLPATDFNKITMAVSNFLIA